MSMQVHWHEGLFLQPHHLQRLQKELHDLVGSQRRQAWAYPYGLIEARLSRDELENMRIRFDKLRAIMPSGLEIAYPDNTELPSLDIKDTFSKGAGQFTVFLGVPLWQEDRANVVATGPQADTRAKLLYRLRETECADENTGENRKPMQFRSVNARLLLEDEDHSDLEILPLLRIGRAAGQDVGLPREVPEYVPPCFVLAGSPSLRELVRDLAAQVEASRKELVVQLTRGGFSLDTLRGVQFEQLLRLRTLSRFSARLPALVQAAAAVPPFNYYLELHELLGELTSLHPDRDEFESAPYDHDNPYLSFSELSAKIRGLLRGAVAASYLSVTFKDDAGMLTARLDDRHFAEPNAYFLGIKTRLDATALARFVTDGDKFKLMPKTLAMSRIFGIGLQEERHAPLTLPAATDLHYFRLLTTEGARKWDQIKQEKAAVLRWERAEIDLGDATFTLYMTLPS